jgi:WD40 repeat protein
VSVERENQPVEVRILDVTSGRQIQVLRGPANSANDLAFSPDGTRLVAGCLDQTARVWDVATGREVFVLRGHTSPLTVVAFSPDGARLAAGSMDRTVRIWDTTTGKEVLVLRGHAAIVASVNFSPDGRRIYSSSSDRTIRIWDAETGRELGYLIPGPGSLFNQFLACSPDGRRLAVAVGKTIQFWDAAVLTAASPGAQPALNPSAGAEAAAGDREHPPRQ